MRILIFILLQAMRLALILIVAVLLPSGAFGAISNSCQNPPSGGICVCDQKFQDTSYTTVKSSLGQHGAVLGDQDGALMPCRYDDIFSGIDLTLSWTYGAGDTFASMLKISTDSTVLSGLPNRDTSKVQRFLRFAQDQDNQTIRFGHVWPGGTIPSGLKRWALRWYAYHSSDYAWVNDGNGCYNGKIAHNSHGHQTSALMTLTVHGTTDLYSFLDGSYLWSWSGHSGFEGFNGGIGPRPGSSVDSHSYRGKWYRFEVVASNVKSSDTGGYEFQYFVKNITDNTPEVEDVRFSSSCTGCMASDGAGGNNWTWDSSVHPLNDMYTLATEFYRGVQAGYPGYTGTSADKCAGWQGWVYMTSIYWTTNSGQRIGAAAEVEGGGSSPTTSSAYDTSKNFHRRLVIIYGAACVALIFAFPGGMLIARGVEWIKRRSLNAMGKSSSPSEVA